ncbi:fibronectin type III domain-containing protein [Gaoshiqia sp. Z1-71]|uniref:fibronectin type III domain-containing protein n=1 Tax=Gaoshiqia hydrogeniformans TaxID=3290090 RepID=UPI003BF89A63
MKYRLNLLFRLIIVLFLLISFDLDRSFAQVNFPSEMPDRIVLNATPDPASSMAITWRTDTTVKTSFCELQPLTHTRVNPENSSSFTAKTISCRFEYPDEPEVAAHQHSVVLNELTPGEKYMYRVGSEDRWSEWFEFRTPAPGSTDFSFVYFGDPQVSLKPEWSRVVRKAWQTCPDCRFMLYGGDIINRAERDLEWYEWFEAGSFIFASLPQLMTPGNHDYKDGTLDSHWNAQFTQPTNGPSGLEGTCFFVDYPNLRVISIDSAVGSELEDEDGYPLTAQKAWLDSVLQTNEKDWVVVTTHLPFYSTNARRDNPQLRKHFQPILEKYKVDLVLTGHDHAYGRGRVSDTPGIKPSVVYVVSVSGPKMYEAGNVGWAEHSGSHVQLYQIVTVNGNSLVYRAYAADGELFDRFMIHRKKNGQKKFQEMKPDN